MTEKKDIFDRIMELPGLRVFGGFYRKNKSVLLYIFFGGLTTLISIGSFVGLYALTENTHIANIGSWVLAVLFAYVTNRTWVFEDKAHGRGIFAEAGAFFLGRAATLFIEDIILAVFIDGCGFRPVIVKTAAQVVVFVSNYLLSKFIIFRKKRER
ncbi:MAG: GtrA family protein [Clostridia bacterium]|nr:GtrA family protein [Clostridia bacterium]